MSSLWPRMSSRSSSRGCSCRGRSSGDDTCMKNARGEGVTSSSRGGAVVRVILANDPERSLAMLLTHHPRTMIRPLAAALLWCLAGSPTPLAAQSPSLPQQIADVMVKINGGIHTGYRFAHAKGLVLTGTF